MTARHNIADLGQALRQYQLLSGKTTLDVLEKQGGKLARNVRFSLRALMKPKGAIREEVLARIASGRGIHIRPSVRRQVAAKRVSKQGKGGKFNFGRELVRREIAVRESGRGVLGISARYPASLKDRLVAQSKFGPVLSKATIQTSDDSGLARIAWPGDTEAAKGIAEALQKPRSVGAIKRAIDATRGDIMIYVRRKQKELLTRTIKSLVKR